MFKKICSILIFIFLLSGCSNNSNKIINKQDSLVCIAISPIGSYSNNYLLNLKSNGLLEVSFGNGDTNKNKTNAIIIQDDFLKNPIKREELLNKNELDTIKKLINEVNKRKVISESGNQLDGRIVVIYINNKYYSFYEQDYINDCFGKLLSEIKKCSPLEIKEDGWHETARDGWAD